MNFYKNDFFKYVLVSLILIIFLTYFLLNINNFKPLLNVNPLYLIAIAACDILIIFTNGIFTKVIMQPFNKYISYLESFRVSLISTVGNFFAPVGAGFGFRAVYLKKKHGFSYSDFLSTLYGNYIIIFLLNSLFGLISLYLLRAKADRNYYTLVLIFGCVFIVSLLLAVLKIPLKAINYFENKNRHKRVINIFINISKGWNNIVSNKKLMIRLIAISLSNFLLLIIISKLIIVSLHLTISSAALLLFSVLGSLSLFINITPANLGVKELIYIFSMSVIGFSVNQILMIAIIDRGVLFIILFASWLLLGRLKKLSYKSYNLIKDLK
jgi:uncharacterized protein (TIRG00374 family)